MPANLVRFAVGRNPVRRKLRYSVPMTTIFRSATPDDAPFLGWAIVMAARGHLARGWFDIVLQRDEAFCMRFAAALATAKPRSWWHYSFFTVAEVDGEGACASCCFPDSKPYYVSGDAMAEASEKTGIVKAEQEQLWPRGAFILSATTGEDDCWTIENVATAVRHQGKGLARQTIAHQLDAMRRSGAPRRAQISFLIGNAPAEKAYRAVGFEFAEDKTSPEFEAAMGVPGLRRLTRAL
jgi:translation initiation factor 4G